MKRFRRTRSGGHSRSANPAERREKWTTKLAAMTSSCESEWWRREALDFDPWDSPGGPDSGRGWVRARGGLSEKRARGDQQQGGKVGTHDARTINAFQEHAQNGPRPALPDREYMVCTARGVAAFALCGIELNYFLLSCWRWQPPGFL